MLPDEDRQLLNHILHEMKMPLVCIRGATESIASDLADKGVDLTFDFVSDIESYTELLMRLVTNADFGLVHASDEIRSYVPKRVFLMKDVLKPAVKSVAPLLQSRGFSHEQIDIFGFDSIPPLHMDAHALRQVFFNLLSNCIAYAHQDPKAFSVSLEGLTEPNCFVIYVRDRGIGIEEQFLPRILDAGARGERATSSDASGHGLGLFVASKILRSHGGTIEVSSLKSPTELKVTLTA